MSEEICSYTNMQCLLKLQLVGSIPPVWAGVGFAYFIAEIVDGNLVGNDAPAGPMVHGCMYCARSYHDTLATLEFVGLSSTRSLLSFFYNLLHSTFSASFTILIKQF
jgi:hypothetical protein